jgi:hypothetical protein
MSVEKTAGCSLHEQEMKVGKLLEECSEGL